MRYGYYPGCSLERSSAPYDLSTRAVATALAVQLDEVEDWNCCGATEYATVSRAAGQALVGRNLALAQAQLMGGPGTTAQARPSLVAPCSACFLNLSKVDHAMLGSPAVADQVNAALAAGGLRYDPGSLAVRHLLEALVTDVGLEAIRARVRHPLTALRVAPYYGCLLTRPEIPGHTHDDPEQPTSLDELLRALGAEVVDFPLKTHCCGGHMTQIEARTGFALLHRLLRSADEYRADLIACLCPMCQLNLDAYQAQVNKQHGTSFELPVLYFTQLMGLAFGLPAEELGLGREFVSAGPALRKLGVTPPPRPEPPPRPRARKRDDKTLPMPAARKVRRRQRSAS
jgi:heterodisulfide reductase subunit B